MQLTPLPLVSPTRLGPLLAQQRVERSQTRTDVAAQSPSVGLALDEVNVWSIEEGLVASDDSTLAGLLALYQLAPGAADRRRTRLVVDLDDDLLWANQAPGQSEAESPQVLLRRFAALLHVLRGSLPGSPMPIRSDDIDLLGLSTGIGEQQIEAWLADLIDSDELTACWRGLRNRVRIPAAGVLVGIGSMGPLVLAQDNQADPTIDDGLNPWGVPIV